MVNYFSRNVPLLFSKITLILSQTCLHFLPGRNLLLNRTLLIPEQSAQLLFPFIETCCIWNKSENKTAVLIHSKLPFYPICNTISACLSYSHHFFFFSSRCFRINLLRRGIPSPIKIPITKIVKSIYSTSHFFILHYPD